MEHTLLVSMPEDVYESLMKTAEQRGQQPEEVASRWLTLAANSFAPDSIDKLVGILNTGMPGWSDQHDWYIGQAVLKSMRDDTLEDKD